MSEAQVITVEQLAKCCGQNNLEVIDVRTPLEFREVRVVMARNVPLDALDPHTLMQDRDESCCDTLYVICKSGARGAKAQQKLISAGFTNVVNVEGGTDAWVKAGLPVIRGKKAISLERQVRIAAGAITCLGAMAAIITGNVYLSGIPAFVGAGLMFAGITDNCAMGMIVSKMPWNRCQTESCSA
ncbi:MAG: DUF2892 domain-containing protein [Planctomycetaceae bacterium]|nr:DUF2892 domain-containing protein [Planctomycetaceae bacterium]MCA9112651.1 DUF2892 domain-containing protein [Planctomycetaceae bacterium]